MSEYDYNKVRSEAREEFIELKSELDEARRINNGPRAASSSCPSDEAPGLKDDIRKLAKKLDDQEIVASEKIAYVKDS